MHTQNVEPIMVPLPYFNNNGVASKRILVKPNPIPERTNEAGVILPENTGKVAERGTVASADPSSFMKPGDQVDYKLIERGPAAESFLVDIDNVTYHLLFENEIWACNDIPLHRLFIEPRSGIEIGESGLIAPDDALGLLQYGTVRVAPLNSEFKAGDEVGYRRNEQNIYPHVTLDDGKRLEVLFENEVYTINGKVSSYRMIIKIDKVAQNRKRSRKGNGLLLHKNFIHMKRNLQWGIVKEIGEKAAEMYPGVTPGSYVAVHHFIEHHQHRLIGEGKNKKGEVISEYRILDCADLIDREVYAKMDITIRTSKDDPRMVEKIHPFGDLYFAEWNFNLMKCDAVKDKPIDDAEKFSFDLSKYRDLEEMRGYIDTKKKAAAARYAAPYNSLVTQIERFNPAIKEEKDHRDALETKIEELKRSADFIGNQLNKNYLVACKVIAPDAPYPYVVTTYKELYHIDLFDKRYLVVYPQFILGYLKSKSNMTHVHNYVPIADKVLIEPINEDKEHSILIPKNIAAERPSRGKVISVGPGTNSVEMLVTEGDIVNYRSRTATEIEFEEGKYLIMGHNDLLGVL